MDWLGKIRFNGAYRTYHLGDNSNLGPKGIEVQGIDIHIVVVNVTFCVNRPEQRQGEGTLKCILSLMLELTSW